MHEFTSILAAFTAPMSIGTNPPAMLWMFPLLAGITLVYKATKMRVLLWKRFVMESLILFLTVSAFMIAAVIVLNLITWLITS